MGILQLRILLIEEIAIMDMISNRPYILRAMYDWIVDNKCTPYILIEGTWPGVILPNQFEGRNEVVLNISPMATRDLSIGNEKITFLTRFKGEAFTIILPVNAILAVYAQENGQGMVFEAETYLDKKGEKSEVDDKKTDYVSQECQGTLSLEDHNEVTKVLRTVEGTGGDGDASLVSNPSKKTVANKKKASLKLIK